MDIRNLKEEFLKRYGDYENDVNNFFYYLKEEYDISIDNPNIEIFMQGIETEKIKDSLNYLIESGTYKKAETAKKYAVAIGQFFEFVKDNSSIKNKDLFDELARNGRRENSYIARMMRYIENSEKLKPKEALGIIDRGMAKDLLKWCNDQLSSSTKWEEELGYKKASAAICIKMMLLYGITYRNARVLRVSQIDRARNEIGLGRFKLRMPVYLGKQMCRFLDYKEKKEIYNPEGYLFTDRRGKAWTGITSSSGIPNFLKYKFGITDVTGIIKYGIRQLLIAGLNDYVIKEITGASDEVIGGCIEKEDDEKVYREINNKLVTVELYYDF